MTPSCDFRVTLLGTGAPTPRADRFGPSTLVEAGDQKLLIDAGRGAAIQLYQLTRSEAGCLGGREFRRATPPFLRLATHCRDLKGSTGGMPGW
jgi:hypothetical protein